MKLILMAVVILGACMLLLSVRIIFGRRKEFLHGHACRQGQKETKTTKTGRDLS